jgi:hypothetical protein
MRGARGGLSRGNLGWLRRDRLLFRQQGEQLLNLPLPVRDGNDGLRHAESLSYPPRAAWWHIG